MRKTLALAAGAVCTAALALPAATAAAGWRTPPPACTIFAAPHGDPSAVGGSAGEATSVSSALSSAEPGSVVCFEAGRYDTPSNIWLSRSGTRSAPIVYRSYGGRALFQYTGGRSGADYLDGGLFETSNGSDWRGTHDIVIDGLTIDGADLLSSGIAAIQGSHHITIENCVIRNTGESGIQLDAIDYATVVHNLVYHAGYNQGWSSGISLWYGGTDAVYGGESAWYDRARSFHNVIADNIVSGSYDNSSNHTDGNGIIIDGSGSIPPALLINNLVYENGGRGIEINANTGNVWVVNNTAYADGLDPKISGGQAPEFAAYDATDVHFINDLADGHHRASAYIFQNYGSRIRWGHDLGFGGQTLGIASGLIGDPGSYRYANPRLKRPPAIPGGRSPWAHAKAPWRIGSDFAPRSYSPARRAGMNPLAAHGMSRALARVLRMYMATDLAGNRRGSSIDVGAY